MSLQDPTSVKNELNVNRWARRAKYISSQETGLQPRISHLIKNEDKVPSITYVFPLEIRILKAYKGKAIPVQSWTGTEGSKSFRIPDFKIISTRRWSRYQPYAPAAFTPQEIFLVLISVARDGIVVKALRYKLAGRGFDSPWCSWNFSMA